MLKNKPLTKTDLIQTLKTVGVATKDDVRQIVNEEIDKRDLTTKTDLKNFATKTDLKNELGKSEHRLERKLVIRMNKMERNLRQSVANLAMTTPTRREFEDLKQSVSGRYGFV